ncbi:MAG: hypothetical protein OXT09_36845 [Myxococcales bacterium]|nr:hypothetical protein [Myxococcales bacterium]
MGNRMRVTVAALTVLGLPPLAGCEDSEQAGYLEAEREFRDFQKIYPILARDCGFHTCHGAEERFFRIYAPGRDRLESETRAFDAVTGAEASASYVSARSMVDGDNPEDSLLLRKPLSVAAGGAEHEGVDGFGRDVYRTVNDEGYVAIASWVFALPQPEEDEEE